MTAPATPAAWTMIRTLAGVTLRRLARGKAIWVGALIAALPVVVSALRAGGDSETELLVAITPLLVLLPPLFIASSIGEEIESRTSTYLWSRPIARGAVLAGKLCALVPVVLGLVLAAWLAGHLLDAHALPSGLSCVALALGGTAIALISTGLATLAPRHGMALTITYMMVDTFIGAWPFSLAELSVTHQIRTLADGSAIGLPVIAMAAIGGLWGAIALRQIRRIEV